MSATSPVPSTLIRLWFAAFPIAGIILAIVFLLRYPLTKEVMGGIRAKLVAKRGTV